MDRNPISDEAQRWLGAAEKLLVARDLLGAKSFAIRVRETFPRLESAADDVIAVADTLLAGEFRINGLHDWYAILNLPRYTHNLELVAGQYRRLALLLNPHRNRLPLASDAFRLVTEAWSVLSNPSKKLFYDNEFGMFARYDFGSGSGAAAPAPTPELQEHQFLQRNNHFYSQNQHQSNNQFQTQTQTQTHNHNQNQNQQQTMPPPPPPQTQTQMHAQSQRSSHQFQQQTPRKSPRNSRENRAPVVEERPNLNNVAESSRSARTIDFSSAPAPAPAPAPPPVPVPAPPPAPAASPARRAVDSTPPEQEREPEGPSFWTTCPYCLIMYEYPKIFEDCVLRCQNCKRAFHAAVVPSPPIHGEEDTYFCCWGFFPLGFSGKTGGGGGTGSGWAPFSPMFACPIQDEGKKNAGGGARGKRKEGGDGAGGGRDGSPRFIYKDDDIYVDLSEDSDESDDDDDWRTTTPRKSAKKVRTAKGKSTPAKSAKAVAAPTSVQRVTRSSANQANNNGAGGEGGGEKVDGGAGAKGASKGESSRRVKAIATGGRKRGGSEWRKLDLNVEFSNDVEEQPSNAATVAAGVNRGNGAGSGGEEDNIEGIGFFEGLDEFLSSLPILNVVGDDKVKAA